MLTCVEFMLCGCGRFQEYSGASDLKGNGKFAVFNGDRVFTIKRVKMYAVSCVLDLIGV